MLIPGSLHSFPRLSLQREHADVALQEFLGVATLSMEDLGAVNFFLLNQDVLLAGIGGSPSLQISKAA